MALYISCVGMLFSKQAYETYFMNPRKAIADLKAADTYIPRMYMCCGMHAPLVYDACVSVKDCLKEQNAPLTHAEGDDMHDIPYWDAQP